MVSVQKAIINAHSIAAPSSSKDMGDSRGSLVEPPKLCLLLMPTMSRQKDGLPPLESIAEGHAYIIKGFDESLTFTIGLNDCGLLLFHRGSSPEMEPTTAGCLENTYCLEVSYGEIIEVYATL